MSEKVSWGKSSQIVNPIENDNIHWETFSDVHPKYFSNMYKAEEQGLTPCSHCGKGIKDLSKSWVATLGNHPNYRGLFLPNDASERDKVKVQATEVHLGPECATNLPNTHRRKSKG